MSHMVPGGDTRTYINCLQIILWCELRNQHTRGVDMKKKTFHLITSGILSVSLLLGSFVTVQGAEDELFFGQEDYGSPTEYVEDEYSMDGNNAESAICQGRCQ